MEALQTLAVKYASKHPADAARRLETVSSADAGAFLTELDPGAAAAVIEKMSPSTVAAALATIDPDRARRSCRTPARLSMGPRAALPCH